MIISELEKIENAVLHDAILIATYQGHKFNRVYVDREGGCNVKFSNMDKDDIKLFFANIDPRGDISLESINPEYYKDYEFTENGECVIYLPDEFKY